MTSRIVAFTSSLKLGGTARVLVTIMNYYHTLGYRITVVTGTLDGDIISHRISPEIEIKELSFTSSKSALFKIIRFIKEECFDYAFAFSPELAIDIFVAKSIAKRNFKIICRCINTLSVEYKHSDGFFRRYITFALVKIFLKKIDLVIAQSMKMQNDLIENIGLSSRKIVTITNPLDTKFEMEIDSTIRYSKKNYILYVGRFEKQKGLDILIRSFKNIKNESIELYLVGRGSMQSHLERLALNLGVDSRIRFIPFTDRIETYYRQAKVTVLTSYYEGFPNALVEALACGSPVVSFDLPSGPSEIIMDGLNGFLVKYLDEDDLTKKIQLALYMDWDLETVKETARRFSQIYTLPKYERILREMES